LKEGDLRERDRRATVGRQRDVACVEVLISDEASAGEADGDSKPSRRARRNSNTRATHQILEELVLGHLRERLPLRVLARHLGSVQQRAGFFFTARSRE
jgi:hypothetical protein